MRKRLQYASTILFLIAAVLMGALYVVAPTLRLLHEYPHGAAAAVTTPAPTPTVSLPTMQPSIQPSMQTPVQTLPSMSVRGTQLVDANGRPVTLIGVSRSSLEYSCTGDGHFGEADFLAMRDWGMNVVRLPLSSEFWVNADARCPNYGQLVTQAVRNAESAGLYVILDLQWDAPFNLPGDQTHGGAQCPMPDNRQDVAFWEDVATRFMNDSQVIFDLFGEPHNVSWSTWYSGGPITAGCDVVQASGITTEKGTYQAIGMRALAGLVRGIAPNNLIMVAGLDWGYDLSQAARYPLGVANVVYDTHPFNYAGKGPSDWDRAFGNLAAHTAVIAGEFGSYDCGTDYISQAISYFNAHHMSWLAWNWWVAGCGGPSLLAAWPDVPSVPYGSSIRQQMLLIAARNTTSAPAGLCRLRQTFCAGSY